MSAQFVKELYTHYLVITIYGYNFCVFSVLFSSNVKSVYRTIEY